MGALSAIPENSKTRMVRHIVSHVRLGSFSINPDKTHASSVKLEDLKSLLHLIDLNALFVKLVISCRRQERQHVKNVLKDNFKK